MEKLLSIFRLKYKKNASRELKELIDKAVEKYPGLAHTDESKPRSKEIKELEAEILSMFPNDPPQNNQQPQNDMEL